VGLHNLTPNEVVAKGWNNASRLQIVPKYSEELMGDLKLSVEKEIVTVRGDRKKGRIPYVQLDGVEYTSDYLRQNWSMIGNKLIVHIGKDFRTVLAYRPDGTEFGPLSVSGGWAVREHSRDTRQQIIRYRREGLMVYRPTDPVGGFLDFLIEGALKKSKNKKTPKITREANAIAKVLSESDNSELQIYSKKSADREEKTVRAKNRSSFFGPRK
jgi:hypothetical protein